MSCDTTTPGKGGQCADPKIIAVLTPSETMQVPTLPEYPPSTNQKSRSKSKFNRGDPKTENARAKPRAPRVSRGAESKIAVE